MYLTMSRPPAVVIMPLVLDSPPTLARPFIDRPFMERPFMERPFMDSPFMERPFIDRPFMERPFSAWRSSMSNPAPSVWFRTR